MFKSISRTFITGLIAALPLALTIAVIVWLVEFLRNFMGPESAFGKTLGSFGYHFVTSEITAYLIGVIGTLVIIFFLGVLLEAGLKKRWNMLIDNFIDRVPIVRTVYTALKRLMDMLDPKENSELKSMSSVMCHFGGKGGTAVLALMPSSEKILLNGESYYGVLIPTAPVPFGGAILYVPVEWVEPVDMQFDGLLNVYMSMGATSADYIHTKAALNTGKRRDESE